jgi:hypothetical protein
MHSPSKGFWVYTMSTITTSATPLVDAMRDKPHFHTLPLLTNISARQQSSPVKGHEFVVPQLRGGVYFLTCGRG